MVLEVWGLLAACGNAAQPEISPTPPPNALVIGTPLALTGSLATEGNLTKNGYDLWLEEVNKSGGIRIGRQRRMVQTKYYDHASDAEKSAQLAQLLILEEGVGLLLGLYGTAATSEVAVPFFR